MGKRPTDEEIKAVLDEVDDLDLPDGAHWMLCHEKLGMEYGDLFPRMTANPDFFGLKRADDGAPS